jgi:hypothetical protein
VGIERQAARVDLSGAREEYSRVELAKRDDLRFVTPGCEFAAQPINMVSDAPSQRMRGTDNADSHSAVLPRPSPTRFSGLAVRYRSLDSIIE